MADHSKQCPCIKFDFEIAYQVYKLCYRYYQMAHLSNDPHGYLTNDKITHRKWLPQIV